MKRFHDVVHKYRKQTFKDTTLGNLLLALALAITYVIAKPMFVIALLIRSSYFVSALVY